MNNELLQRVTVNPEVCHGKPSIRNTRMTVEAILEYLAAGDTVEDILAEFDYLEREDVFAAIAYAAKVMQMKNVVIPFAA